MTPKKQADPGAAADTTDTAQGFAARWSKRKHAARAVRTTEPPAADTPIAEASPTAPAPILADKDMPPIESITGNSDVSGFFSPGVTEELRRLALRKLFHTPEFNTRCPLDSEFYDCTKLTDMGSIITHEMRDAMQREAEEIVGAAMSKALEEEQRRSAGSERADELAGNVEPGGNVIASEAKQSQVEIASSPAAPRKDTSGAS